MIQMVNMVLYKYIVLKKIERFDFTASPNVTTSNSTRYYSTLAGVKVGIQNPEWEKNPRKVTVQF